jgi:hypothetical protein
MNYKSTKFLQTSFVLLSATALVAFGKIDALAYGTVITLALGNYAHHDVKQKGIS